MADTGAAQFFGREISEHFALQHDAPAVGLEQPERYASRVDLPEPLSPTGPRFRRGPP